MNTLYILPIEPLEERYTAEWYKHLPKIFERETDYNVVQIDGTPTTTSIETGTFLDINSTIHYKCGQMQFVSELFRQNKVKTGDVFFISDLEFWGIESLRMLSQINKVPIRIYGFLHAASYTVEDAFAVAAPYQKYTELGWLAAVDGVFVGTDYHRNAIIDRRIKPLISDEGECRELSKKIIVTGNPIFLDAYTARLNPSRVERKNKIVITNRFDAEKRPDQSLMLALLVQNQLDDVEIVVTTSRPVFKSNQQWLVDLARMYENEGKITIKANLTKEQYHQELMSAKVMISNSIEENFGYCIVEAILHGCSPMLPYGLSHDELVGEDRRYLFKDNGEAVQKILNIMQGNYCAPPNYTMSKYLRAAAEMAHIMS